MVPVFQEKKQLQAFQVEQVQVGQTPTGLVENLWLLASLVASFPFIEFPGWLRMIKIYQNVKMLMNLFFLLVKIGENYSLFNFRELPCVTAGISMAWVPMWPGHLIRAFSFANENKMKWDTELLAESTVSCCFSVCGTPCFLFLDYQSSSLRLYLHHFLRCVILASVWKRSEVCCGTPTKTRAGWPSSDRSVRPRCPFFPSSIGVTTEWYGSWWDSNGRGGGFWSTQFINLGAHYTTLATQTPQFFRLH